MGALGRSLRMMTISSPTQRRVAASISYDNNNEIDFESITPELQEMRAL